MRKRVQPQLVVSNSKEQGNVIGWHPSSSEKGHCCAVEDNLHYWLITFGVILLTRTATLQKVLEVVVKTKNGQKLPKLRVMKPKSEKDCPHCRASQARGAPIPSGCEHSLVSWGQEEENKNAKLLLLEPGV